jgi:DNA-binding GntR family transcriptional regulator
MVVAFAACQPGKTGGFRNSQSEPVPSAVLRKRKSPRRARPGSRVENAYDALKSAIRENIYPPGHFAAEIKVAAQLGMSRTPVHEAAIRLQEEGLVEVLPRRGIRVRNISHNDIRETYELTIALESMAAEVLAARPASAAVNRIVARLEAETRTMESALRKNDLDRWAAADDRFHEILTSECGNGRLSRMASTIRDQTHRARLLTLRLRPLPVRSALEHRAIIEAIRKGDRAAAARTAGAHRRRAGEIMIPLLEKFSTPNA